MSEPRKEVHLKTNKILFNTLVFGLLFSSILASTAHADPITNATCDATKTISTLNSTIYMVVNDVQNATTISESRYCPQGCNNITGMCYGSEGQDTQTFVLIGILLMSLVFAYMGTKITDKHFILQGLMIFISLALTIAAAGMMNQIGLSLNFTQNSVNILEQVLVIVTYSFYIIIAYYIVMYIYHALIYISEASKKKKMAVNSGRSSR